MSRRFTLTPITVALLGTLVASAPVLADDAAQSGNIKEQVTVSPGRRITPQDEVLISSSAVKVLRHVASARGELQGDKPDTARAKDDLDQAEKLLDIIEAALPTTQVKDRIWVAKKHLEYEHTREVLPDLVPIYASLEELVDYMPTAGAKAHLDKAKAAMEQGDKGQAEKQLQAVDDALLYVEADLPLKSTRHLVAQAKADLAKGDAKAADQALSSAEDNVVFVSVTFQAPLTHAKAALWRAWQDYDAGAVDTAKADLKDATAYLEQAAKSQDEVVRQSAARLVSQVRDLHQAITVGEKDFTTRLESTWHRVKALSERSAEYMSTGWQRLRAEGAGKKDLIEAKLQLAYARIDHLYSKDDLAAQVDLGEVKGYLDTAVKETLPDLKAKVTAVSRQVDALEQAIKSGEQKAANAPVFNQAEAQLATLIRQL